MTGNPRRDAGGRRGEPILYGFSVPREAPRRALAERFAAFLLSADGRRILAREHLDALPAPIFVGDDHTDEDAFDVVPEFKGQAFSVGRTLPGIDNYFDCPADVRRWLPRLTHAPWAVAP